MSHHVCPFAYTGPPTTIPKDPVCCPPKTLPTMDALSRTFKNPAADTSTRELMPMDPADCGRGVGVGDGCGGGVVADSAVFTAMLFARSVYPLLEKNLNS